jgi:tungstate transport system substrate-binding protein
MTARLWPLLLLLATALATVARADDVIVLASTTSVENSGLLSAILPQFRQTSGIEVRVVALGTGQALDTARRGDADLVLVHDPDAEERFIAEGHGVNRTEIAWNDFIVVGPASDQAHIAGGRVPFFSRGDHSGTDALEKRLWRAAGINPLATGLGSWYRDVGSGMGAALNFASAMNGYTLSDRGTWLSFGNKGSLKILVQGDPRLINRYDVIQLNPAKHPNAKLTLARRFAEWLRSDEGQKGIAAYMVNGEQLFHPLGAE